MVRAPAHPRERKGGAPRVRVPAGLVSRPVLDADGRSLLAPDAGHRGRGLPSRAGSGRTCIRAAGLFSSGARRPIRPHCTRGDPRTCGARPAHALRDGRGRLSRLGAADPTCLRARRRLALLRADSARRPRADRARGPRHAGDPSAARRPCAARLTRIAERPLLRTAGARRNAGRDDAEGTDAQKAQGHVPPRAGLPGSLITLITVEPLRDSTAGSRRRTRGRGFGGAGEQGGPHATAPTEQAGPGAPPREDTRIARRSDRSDIVLITGSGRRVPLEGQCVIGRAPRPADPGDIQLVALDSSSSALSRSHLRIGFDDRQVWAEDLNSANGTVMVHPTGQRIRLGPQWRTAIVPGAVLLLADESITVERSA